MAKLSARGRTKLAQVSLERTEFPLETCPACQGKGVIDHPESICHGKTCYRCAGKGQSVHLCTWERKTRAYMSDGTCLEKLDVRFPPGPYSNGKDEKHSYGWSVRGKVKEGITVAQWLAMYAEKGWVSESV